VRTRRRGFSCSNGAAYSSCDACRPSPAQSPVPSASAASRPPQIKHDPRREGCGVCLLHELSLRAACVYITLSVMDFNRETGEAGTKGGYSFDPFMSGESNTQLNSEGL